MFMRYRGGGVGHHYMRAIETWLAETGWGSDDVTPTAEFDDDIQEDAAEDPEPGPSTHTNTILINPINYGEVEIEESSEEESESGTDSDNSSESESIDGDMIEDTLDGEYDFSGF